MPRLPEGADPDSVVHDLASLESAGPTQLTFCAGGKKALRGVARQQRRVLPGTSRYCDRDEAPAGMMLLAVSRARRGLCGRRAAVLSRTRTGALVQQTAVDPTASIGEGVMLAPGVVIGPGAEIGAGTRIGPHTVIGARRRHRPRLRDRQQCHDQPCLSRRFASDPAGRAHRPAGIRLRLEPRGPPQTAAARPGHRPGPG